MKVLWDKVAQKKFDKLGVDAKKRIDQAVTKLVVSPAECDVRPMVGVQACYRLRVGDWRIVFSLAPDRDEIRILRLGSRGDVYHGF